MDYIELQVKITPFDESIAEQLIAELSEAGYESFMNTETGLNAYIPVKNYRENILKVLIHDVQNTSKITYTPDFIAEKNWNIVWEENFQPVVIDKRLIICAPFHKDLPKAEMKIVMEPKMAFGTGHHDTTYLMAAALLKFPVKGLQVLDVGCGTGILAIIAAKRGAKKFVDAIDIDVWAKNSAFENARRNRVSHKIRTLLGDASLIQRDKYDLILANINRNILLSDMSTYVMGLRSHGTLMLSGVYVSDLPEITAEAARCGLQKLSSTSKNNWVMVIYSKG